MSRIDLRTISVTLFATSCLFLAGLFSHFSDDSLAPDNLEASPTTAVPLPSASMQTDRNQILDRNLFGSGVAVSKNSPETRAELPLQEVVTTRLPLRLLGTMASEDEDLSEAVIMNKEEDEHMVLRIGDSLEFNPEVSVLAIHPRRVLLQNGPIVEELLMEDGVPTTSYAARSNGDPGTSPSKPRHRTPSTSVKEALGRSQVSALETRAAMERMAAHFASDLEPSFDDDGNIIGLRAADITDGGLLDEAGVTRDDVIVGINGIEIKSAAGAARVLRDLSQCQPMTGLVLGPEGERSVEITSELLEKFNCVN